MFKTTITIGLVLGTTYTTAMCADASAPLRETTASTHSRPLSTQPREETMSTYMDQSVIHECTAGSFAGRLTFPECLQKLLAIGGESYVVDLSNTPATKTVYGKEGDSYEGTLPDFGAPSIASAFNETQVREALLAIQRKEIDYPEFLRQIIKAGVSRYEVYIKQYKTIYFGQGEDSYTENFPPSFLGE